jgi:hypothetical protein
LHQVQCHAERAELSLANAHRVEASLFPAHSVILQKVSTSETIAILRLHKFAQDDTDEKSIRVLVT